MAFMLVAYFYSAFVTDFDPNNRYYPLEGPFLKPELSEKPVK
jgi:hypothetical protein